MGVPDAFADGYAAFLGELEGNHELSAHTRRAYASRLAGFLRWLATPAARASSDIVGQATGGPGADPLTDAGARDTAVRDYRLWLLTEAKRAPATVNGHLTAIDAYYTHLGLGPARTQRIDLPPQAPRALDASDLRQVLGAAERLLSPRDATIVRTLYHAGLGTGELVALDLDDVPTTARTGKVVVRAGEGPDRGKPRVIPANPSLRAALSSYKLARQQLLGADASPALFLNRYGDRLSTRAVDEIVTGLGAEIGLAQLTPHVLRVTFATDLLHAGADIVLVSELLGHVTLEATRTYTRPTDPGERERAVQFLHADQ